MKPYWLIRASFMKSNGTARWPFVFMKPGLEKDHFERLKRHEETHIWQQLEMLVIPFYIVYGINFLVNVIKVKRWLKDTSKPFPFCWKRYFPEYNKIVLNNATVNFLDIIENGNTPTRQEIFQVAFRNVLHELEAFYMDEFPEYLSERKFWAWVRF